MTIFKSASKVVFVLMAVTASGGFVSGILESKDFMLLAGMAFTYYFNKQNFPAKE